MRRAEIALVAAVGVAFAPALLAMARVWSAHDYTSHGFMVPLPASLLNPIIVRLQLWVSTAGVAALHALGFSVLREGNVVLLPGGERLFVDEACSGITSVVTLLPLGALLAYLGTRGAWRRAALMLAVVPVAMLGNWLRVLGTVSAAQRFGTERVLAGPLHEAAGLLTFLFACSLLIALGALLRVRSAPARAPT